MLHTARPPLLVALILLPLVRVVFEHTQTCPEDVVVALAISGYADGEHTLNRFITSLVQNVLETAPTRTEFDAFIWLQDNAIEQRLKSVLRRAAAEARVPVIATRGESLLALPVVYSEAETDVIGREYALLPESALLPGTFNTLRMLFKFAGVEALRAATLEAAAAKGRHRHHAYVLRIRPDLELLGRLNVVSPVLLNDAAAAAAAWSRGTAVLVPWVCPASQLLFDQLQIMRPQAAASLARLADAGSSAILANCSHPPSTYPERMVWHAMAREGVEPALAHFPETRLIGPVGVGVRDSYAKLRVDYPSSSSSATPSDAASEHLSSHATTPTTDEKRAAAGCEGERRPYHTVLTSSSGGYQTWQCRVMFHHWKLQKRRDPCGEMGGFTRLLTSHSGNRDGRSFDDEIPTFYVKELSGGAARGYVVANRPYSMTQFVQHADFRKVVTEEYVYIAETDHVMLRPLPNLATAQMPAGFNFGYMVAWGQAKIVDKFVPGLGGKTDPVGPSPIIIHVEQLVKIVQPWYDFTLKICDDREAVQALGWVREMWGWCIAAGSLGIKHRVLDAFQYEGGSIGNRERPLIWPVGPTPVTPERAEMPYYILHYTYGIEYSAEGLPMELQVGEWSLDKRHYMGQHPPKGLLTPPKCAHDRAHVLSGLINNASATLGERWPGGGGQTDRFNRVELRGHPLRSHAVASKLLGTGPWMLSGRDGGSGAYRLEKMWILNNGWLNSGKGHGRWGLLPKKGGGDGYEDDAVVLQICQRRITVKAVFSASEAWTLVDADDATHVIGKLEAPAEALELWRQPVLTPTSELAARVEGSGPFRGGSTGAIVLLRAGVLAAEGGPYMRHTRWRALEASSGREAIALGGADLGAEASTHAITADFTDCWILRFPERRAGGLLPAAEPAGRPPRYGDGVSARSAEWILQPSATLCKDVCAGLTLRPMTDADHAGSIAARSLEGCCGFSWAGFGGMKLEPNGVLKTPWGSGRWGAPPEAQGTDEGAFLAEFAGFKHLVRVRITSEAGGKRAHKQMQSTRCSDNDRSNVMVTDGEPKLIAS